MLSKQTVCLRRLGETRSGEVMAGRFFRNSKVTVGEIVSSGCKSTGPRVAGRHVLAIQDTTELNYQAHAGRVKGLGATGNGSDKGFFAHPLLTVDAQNGACLGLAHLAVWTRGEPHAEHYKKLPIEEKESYRWIETAQAGKAVLQEAARVTVVADRESDIYELWSRVPDARTDLLIRACRDRIVEKADGELLFAYMDRLPITGSSEFNVTGREGKRTAHKAQMVVRCGEVTIRKPARCKDTQAPQQLTLTVIDVREDESSVVAGEAPTHWRLLTTHRVVDMAGAVQCIEWYSQRWQIEQLFRTLKKQGLNLETSQLENGDSLQKLCCFAVFVATRILQLTLARDGTSARPASDTFDQSEIAVLEQLQSRLEGKTEKQKNPHPKHSLAWASWTIARLGGWKGYASERPPGPITMKNGLDYFSRIVDGYLLHYGS